MPNPPRQAPRNSEAPFTAEQRKYCGGLEFTSQRSARQLSRADGERFDLIVGMDGANIRNISRILGAKHSAEVCRLLDLTESPRDVADPWYTGDFEQTYRDVCAGCEALIRELSERGAL